MSYLSSPISGFTAVPNPYMIPLLFLQSLLIGAGFGIGYQGERRKLSAMSNEKFNEVDLGLYAFDQFKEILARNDFGKMLDLMHPLTEKLATSFGELINNLPDIFSGFAAGATGQTQKPSGVAGFTGGLPSVDAGIGDFFTSIAELIRKSTNFTAGGNPAATYQAIIKEKKEENKANQPNISKLQSDVQSRNIQQFKERLESESDVKQNVRAEVEKWAQQLVESEAYTRTLKDKQGRVKNKQVYRVRLTLYYSILQRYNKAAAVFRNTFPKQTSSSPTWENRKPAKF